MTKEDIIINVDEGWQRDDTYEGIFPKGARDKSVYFSPKQPEPDFIRPDHRYLFKRSNQRYPWQFWIEIIAYRIGRMMGVEVPPAYVGYSDQEDPGERAYGALIEWFYDRTEKYIDGGLLLRTQIPDFDEKKGTQHNLITALDFPLLVGSHLLTKYLRTKEKEFHKGSDFESDKKTHKDNTKPPWDFVVASWAKILTFDTIIGNIDRHQDNWGVIISQEEMTNNGETPEQSFTLRAQFSPAFDNGTAMGYEVLEENFPKFNDESYLLRYLTRKTKARHHMKWSLDETEPMNFFDFMHRFVTEYPGTKSIILSHLNITRPQVENELRGLVDLVPEGKYRLTPERLDFTIKLLMKRIELFKETLE